MAKLFVAVLLFSTVSMTVGHQGFNLDVFLKNPKIKLLSNPGVKGAYPGDDTNYADLFKALAALEYPFTAEEVKSVLHGHAPALYNRVQAARHAFVKVRDGIKNAEDPWDFLVEVNLALFGLNAGLPCSAGLKICARPGPGHRAFRF